MPQRSESAWDVESLQNLRLIGNRRFRRTLGVVVLGLMAAQAGLAAWVLDFRGMSRISIFGFAMLFLLLLLATISIAVLDVWSMRLEFAVKRRELAHELVERMRGDAAPRNGNPAGDTT